ncbi:hypothetical protein HPB52_015372 [Rhipicephalus sanguineus]|uniref:CCHC-type domain-containing protein n=1 Tax=Rhipicephalus sanguineus TaxID=34632 RepID=A0A9D4Q3A1_RHISA|nr:hypothetical protein HPB52_015372 [Rhipicephalus sanguineus]
MRHSGAFRARLIGVHRWKDRKREAAKRIGSAPAVILPFDEDRVPNFVRKRVDAATIHAVPQADICYACGRFGHCADICPNPGDDIY